LFFPVTGSVHSSVFRLSINFRLNSFRSDRCEHSTASICVGRWSICICKAVTRKMVDLHSGELRIPPHRVVDSQSPSIWSRRRRALIYPPSDPVTFSVAHLGSVDVHMAIPAPRPRSRITVDITTKFELFYQRDLISVSPCADSYLHTSTVLPH
jgi:hypothetical protein